MIIKIMMMGGGRTRHVVAVVVGCGRGISFVVFIGGGRGAVLLVRTGFDRHIDGCWMCFENGYLTVL